MRTAPAEHRGTHTCPHHAHAIHKLPTGSGRQIVEPMRQPHWPCRRRSPRSLPVTKVGPSPWPVVLSWSLSAGTYAIAAYYTGGITTRIATTSETMITARAGVSPARHRPATTKRSSCKPPRAARPSPNPAPGPRQSCSSSVRLSPAGAGVKAPPADPGCGSNHVRLHLRRVDGHRCSGQLDRPCCAPRSPSPLPPW